MGKKTSQHTGDILVDFLRLSGVLPPGYKRSPRTGWPELPAKAIAAAERLLTTLNHDPERWLEVPATMGKHCGIVDDPDRAGVLSIDRMEELPGLEDYPWHKRGPLWYSSGVTINGSFPGPVVFLRDGMVTVDPSDPNTFTHFSWDEFHTHEWPARDSDGEINARCLGLDHLVLDHAAEGDPDWGEFSFYFADLILRRVLAAAQASPGPFLRTPPIEHWTEELVCSMLA